MEEKQKKEKEYDCQIRHQEQNENRITLELKNSTIADKLNKILFSTLNLVIKEKKEKDEL